MLLSEVSPATTQNPFVSSMPEYSESLDRTRPSTLLDTRTPALIKQNRWSNNLVYHFTDTDEIAIVPNIWYNQPVEWRIEFFRWDIKRRQDHVNRLEAEGVRSPVPGRLHFFTPEEARQASMREERATIARLEAIVAEMVRTGIVTH
jgi:hypothetical protein